MSKNKPFYITTTLPYVNADPHIGFALEIVQADVLARYRRLQGGDVFFNTGTDEHGQKISRVADEKGEDRQKYVDYYAGEFNKLKEGLDLSYDNFVRTTDVAHQQAAQHIWQLCEKKGDIYKKKYKGLYCVGCESFKTESDLVDGKCSDHQKAPEEVEEENYFFKLSEYGDYLKEYLSQDGVIVPEWRRMEALTFVDGGLEDLSISREKKRMDWGVSVPGDDEHVMYVWFDALTNYISTLGWPDDTAGTFQKFWADGETVQMAGKDQIRFQSIIWQAMLKSAGVPATSQIFYHGFINSGGQKMSKSIGNVISPYDMIERYGTDATRYLLLRHVHPTDDSDLTWERMDELYTANLSNGLGNLLSRIMKMATSYGVTAELPERDTILEQNKGGGGGLWTPIDRFESNVALDMVWKRIKDADAYVTAEEPFKKIKTNRAEAQKDVAHLLIELWHIGIALEPCMPQTAAVVQAMVQGGTMPKEPLFKRLEQVYET